MNPSVKVDFGGQPRSRGSRKKGAPEQWTKERHEMGGGNPSRHPRSPGTGASPALTRSIRAKHRVVLHREGSGNREDGDVRDEGVEV